MTENETGLPRPVEAALALGGLAAGLPVLAVAGALIKLTSRGPVLFRQQRVGVGGKPFTFYKLRTMRQNAGGPGVTAGDDVRITRVGKFLRDTKLDELPSLWNVIKGDLSFVGPRPEVPKYVRDEEPLWRDVLKARPGLTSPVTIAFRNEEELLASVEGDRERWYFETLLPYKLIGHREYLLRRSWRTDAEVILKTVWAVARASSAASPTREEIERRVQEYRRDRGSNGGTA